LKESSISLIIKENQKKSIKGYFEKKITKKHFVTIVSLCWIILSAISINHLADQIKLPFSKAFLGCFFLFTIFVTILGLGWNNLKSVTVIFCSFFIINAATGPFLDPPADPLDHLRISYEQLKTDIIPKINTGYWHYKISGLLLRFLDIGESGNCFPTLIAIRILHGFYCALLAVFIFIFGVKAGLNLKWSILSCFMAYAFIGTHKFSYFGYYSLGPSFTSMIIYWIWILVFFISDKNTIEWLIKGLSSALLLIPIVIVNHIQEAVFICLVVLVWITFNIQKKIYYKKNIWLTSVWMILLILALFILPQFEIFRDFIGRFFLYNDWDKNQSYVLHIKWFHLMGKIWRYRVSNTLGFFGFLPAIIFLVILIPSIRRKITDHDVKIWILGILPFVVYCTPLLNYIWLANCKWTPSHIRYYYRICYASFYWLTIAYACYRFEPSFSNLIKKKFNGEMLYYTLIKKNLFFAISIILILALGFIRSGPIYGKLDFIFINTTPWWPAIKPIIKSIDLKDKRKVLTDPITSNLLASVFNINVVQNFKKNIKPKVLNIKEMEEIEISKKYQVIVNLKGFHNTWVPIETGHWKKTKTSEYYNFLEYKDKNVINELRNSKYEHIKVIL
jgi:hypothetical protein